jgi:hypothetical protein
MEKEIFKDIPEYEGKYQVSNLGNVKSLPREIDNGIRKFISKERILKPSKDGGGYYHVIICKEGNKKSIKVHVLVAMAFLNHVPNGTQNIEVDHKNEIKTDNRVENLQILSGGEHRRKTAKSRNTSSKYTGVYWNKSRNKWQSNIRIDGKLKFLGYFSEEHQAHLVYQKALNNLNNN